MGAKIPSQRSAREGRPEHCSTYIGADDATADAEALRGADVIVRLEPGAVRVCDFADEYDSG